jgi:hypothetical protein
MPLVFVTIPSPGKLEHLAVNIKESTRRGCAAARPAFFFVEANSLFFVLRPTTPIEEEHCFPDRTLSGMAAAASLRPFSLLHWNEGRNSKQGALLDCPSILIPAGITAVMATDLPRTRSSNCAFYETLKTTKEEEEEKTASCKKIKTTSKNT